MKDRSVTIIGAGLAGSEAAWQLVKRGFQVRLIEMRPKVSTEAHQSDRFAELVCSNSLRSNQLTNAVGLLKEEMRKLDSLIIRVADQTSVPAGSALAVDRVGFSSIITETLRNHPLVEVVCEEVTEIPEGNVIVATGPLTSKALSSKILELTGESSFYFYDAAAPIIEKDSIDFSIAYYKSRYDKGDADYINCPMDKQQFEDFYNELIHAQVVPLKEFEKEIFFDGCMPFEEMAKRGVKTLTFGPMKPVGLWQDGKPRPYAVVQLRRDDAADTLYNIVGFQTHLTWGEQKRILRMIPGLQNAEIVRYGVMHRNSYLNSPIVLKATYQANVRENLFFAGQMTGVEGYVESAASGLLAGINMARRLSDKPCIEFPAYTMIGAMAQYITHASPKNFQPMNANFGIIHSDVLPRVPDRKEQIVKRSLDFVVQWSKDCE
ncbi:MAG: methylenetetrahydrofolate--tRNA-(uracil(54)-C(5))-methyltransferase (FADH(2)-oxidizing) TrmFO [Erysipelotrichaceae bacterium]|nr:methylenetetrahydrofolate--tRNA-(uracil(54)-C(5))-methyltransferase (FADH(2)-oxidizing) TrmFO [Erysipelotrichaceae bacterium]